MSLQIASSAFGDGDRIPSDFTADGPDKSPQLTWSSVPDETMSLVLICDDPDAPMGTWVHWVYYNMPAEMTELQEGVEPQPEPPAGGIQGKNDFGRIGYGGPSPPPGKPHRYFFKLYALDAVLDLGPGATKAEVEAAMENHILDSGETVGTYQR